MGKLKARMIIEIMGRPADHIKETLNTLVVKLGSEEGVSLIEKRYHEPNPIKETKDLYTTFADVDAEFDSLEILFSMIMAYLPSNVEVYEPEKIKLNSNELNFFGNSVIGRLHKYDEIAKGLMAEREMLIGQLNYLKNGGKIEEIIKFEKKIAEERSKAEKKSEEIAKDKEE